MSKQASPQAWMERARRELAAAEAVLEYGILEDVFFHCQQALELGLKSLYLQRHGRLAPKIHDLVELAGHVPIEIPSRFGPLFRWLSRLYARTRYDIELVAELQDEEGARSTLAATEEAFEWLAEQLR